MLRLRILVLICAISSLAGCAGTKANVGLTSNEGPRVTDSASR